MPGKKYLLGIDVGSSSVKASLVEAATGRTVASATSPKKELEIVARKPGWAEQDPQTWWLHVKKAVAEIASSGKSRMADVSAIGISYQMHGLVLVDKNKKVLRPSIIWCDSRAVEIGARAFGAIGAGQCLARFLNSPGNFTASKLKWVKDNEPAIYNRAHKMMLPGDYIAMMLTGEITTTPSGLSEGILWDFQSQSPASRILDTLDLSHGLLPEVRPTFSVQGQLTKAAARELGLKPGVPISYRGGDQPNNALSLNVLNPGEVATTAGTSGVVYGVTDKAAYDGKSRVNSFVHVNYTRDKPRYGVLLCLNGTGILNSWVKHNVMTVNGKGLSYKEIDALAGSVPVGSDGLVILPYGNGAERTLQNRNIGTSIQNLQFNVHTRAHVARAVQEGIVFALAYGLDIMRDMGVTVSKVRAGNANMFLSPLFAKAFATVTGAQVELYNTDGAAGAARGAGIGAGIYRTPTAAFAGLKCTTRIDPVKKESDAYRDAYKKWREVLFRQMGA